MSAVVGRARHPSCGRALALGLALAFAVGGCASAPSRPAPASASAPLQGPLAALVAGEVVSAEALDQAVAAAPGSARLALVRALQAFQRGDDRAALAATFALLEAGASPELFVAAAASRLPALFDSAGTAEDEARALALLDGSLPWEARVSVAEALDAASRRRGDRDRVAQVARRLGCPSALALIGVAGRLPHLDLDAPVPPGGLRRTLTPSGCRFAVPPLEARSGVRVLEAEVDLPAGPHALVLEFLGPASVQVGDGPVRVHGAPDVYGPRVSAWPVDLPAGRHRVRLRLGTHGGPAEVALAVMPRATVGARPAGGDVIDALAALLVAEARGDADGILVAAERLRPHRRFALALAALGAALAQDPTRPHSLVRAEAQALSLRAVGLDPSFARVWRDLAALDLESGRPLEAVERAERAVAAAPDWWPGALVLVDALRLRGLERDADRVLDRALVAARRGGNACPVLQLAYRRAQQLYRFAEEDALATALVACDAQSEVAIDRLRLRGALPEAERELERLLGLTPDPHWLGQQRAEVLVAGGRAPAAAALLESLLAVSPRDAGLGLRLVDAVGAAGDPGAARALLASALRQHPARPEVRQAARVHGLPLPLDEFRVDGAQVVRDFAAAGRRYEAHSVLVLDRTVAQVFPDGTQGVLTHNIVRVQTKEGIERWGEIQVPEGAELLTLRTHKPDGSRREPEEIAGKPTISAPDLAVGDFVEWETLEFHEPEEAYAPGFVGERFYFQSTEAPLDLSEYLVVLPADVPLDVDGRAGAPAPTIDRRADGTQVYRFVARHRPQLFAERAAPNPIDWIASVRVSSGASLERWGRHLDEQLWGLGRTSPALRALARQLADEAGDDRTRRAAAVVRWVTTNVELENELLEPATATLARRRGNRAALMIALARAMGVPAHLALVRSPFTAPGDTPVSPQELDDFTDLLVRFETPAGVRYVDPRLRRAPLGYVPPALSGGLAYVVGRNRLERTEGTVADGRAVSLDLRLGADGAGEARVTETLTGWPALEWAEILDRVGQDEVKLRQDFEQRSLAQHFPGAQLGTLEVELRDDAEQSVQVVYTLSGPQMASVAAGELRFQPAFFRSQPGRRFATEGSRRTTLLLGVDVPTSVKARLRFPEGAELVDLGPGGAVAVHPSGGRYVERRTRAPGPAPVVELERQARLPFVRVSPADYEGVAARLRRVDPWEVGEIRARLPR